MTRLRKGLDYFPLGVDFFQGQGVRVLEAKYGADGPVAYLYLLCEIYRTGYALSFDDESLQAFSAELKIPHDRFLEILGVMASRGLIDAGLYAGGVLSSREIQRTWQEALRGRASHRSLRADRKTWLLNAGETESYVCFNGEEQSPSEGSGVAELAVASPEVGGQASNGRKVIVGPGFPGERHGGVCPKKSCGKAAEGCGGKEDLTALTDEDLRLLGQRLDAEAATPAREGDLAEGGAFWTWAARKEAHSREVARRKESVWEKWHGGKRGDLMSYEDVMEGWGLSTGVRQWVRAMLRHCQINGQTYTNDRLDDLCARLMDLPDDASRAEALQTALDRGYSMIR